MSTTTKLKFEEFQNLPEQEGAIFELDEGDLLMEPSPALRHNLIRQRIAMKLIQFAEAHNLGSWLKKQISGWRKTPYAIPTWHSSLKSIWKRLIQNVRRLRELRH